MDSPGPGTPLCLSVPSPMGFFTGTLVLPSTAAICKQSVCYPSPKFLRLSLIDSPKRSPMAQTVDTKCPFSQCHHDPIICHFNPLWFTVLYKAWTKYSFCPMLGLRKLLFILKRSNLYESPIICELMSNVPASKAKWKWENLRRGSSRERIPHKPQGKYLFPKWLCKENKHFLSSFHEH